ncbi:hypothetical protein IC006_1438 [Sulfuracidifex tepidarius]|uniref:Uncharacterized protein n=2 Tax=Sulfuracidifex tepidarius TaxID=1294262 RepID=A0A510E2Z1_9CREN|nr:hypothetical protein IC006_1438 [Sulfuracidifex tepidarius]BBG26891.1 hypothetical protein IC007_1414 [Sulfuracidifex tepidarius]
MIRDIYFTFIDGSMKFRWAIDLALLLVSGVLIFLSLGSTGKAYVFSSYVMYPLIVFMALILFMMKR